MIIALCILAWWFTGVLSFIFWFSKDHDIYLDDLIFIMLMGVIGGPIAFLLGWFIHGDELKPFERILIRRRRKL